MTNTFVTALVLLFAACAFFGGLDMAKAVGEENYRRGKGLCTETTVELAHLKSACAEDEGCRRWYETETAKRNLR
jgi:hypothetical protein